MDNNWAAEHLLTIRTLMERSAVYRRALAPITTFVGIIGIAAAIAGWALRIENLRSFALYWMAVCLVVIAGAFILVRRQALSHAEPFWSPPTRRVAQAMLPALLVGLLAGLVFNFLTANLKNPGPVDSFTLLLVWTVLYGLALHAAGFFMPRGIRLFAWGFLIAGIGGISLSLPCNPSRLGISPHLAMGVIFGASHLAYGVYLYFTEPRKNEA